MRGRCGVGRRWRLILLGTQGDTASRAEGWVRCLGAAALGVYAFIKRTSWWGAIPAVFAIVVGAFLPFTVSISTQIVERDSVIEVGDAMPQFMSIDGQGQAFDSASLNGHLVLIKFFRAHW